jgi:hypothetical protein
VDSDLDGAGYGFESESLIDGVRDRVGKVGEEYDVLGRPLLREGVVCSGCRDGGTVSVVNGAAGLQHYLSKLVSSHTRRTPGHAARAPHRRSGPVALCEEEPDHLGGRVGAHRVGEGPDRAPSVPRVPAATHRPGLSEDDAGDVGVHGAGGGVGSGALIEGKGSARAVLQADITLDGVRVPAGNVLPGARAASKTPLGSLRDANRRTGKLRSSGISHARAAPGARRHRRAHN